MADPKIPEDDETETIRQAGSRPEDADPSTRPASRTEAESVEGEVPDVTREQAELDEDLPSNRAQERGGP